ncbi:MAG: HAMP domain-containing sensor histidine kinase [Gammaproteobacteria bacterium]
MFSERLDNIWHSATFRLGIRFMALFAVSFLIVGMFMYWQTETYMERELRTLIDADVAESQDFYVRYGLDRMIAEIEERTQQDPFSVGFLLNDRCRPAGGNVTRLAPQNHAVDLCEETDADGWLLFELDIDPFGSSTQGSAWDDDVYARLVSLSDKHQLIVGRMVGNLEDAQGMMFDALSWGLLITLGLAVIGSIFMARSVNNRLESINRISRQIRRGDLSRRMPSMKGGDEFDRLGGNLNEMLDQIESLMAGVRDVSNSIAHDLRTPLTRLRTHLEQLQDGAQSDEMRAKIENTLAEADALLATFSSLLRIAQIEAGNRRSEFGEVGLDELINDVVELYEPLAAEKGLQLMADTTTPVRASGDRDLLFQAISNLVDNAIKYTPANGTVAIRLGTGPAGARVVVADSGAGIPAEERTRVLERFYRLETHRGSPGSGLGLSLVAAVVSLHGGSVTLEDHCPGLRVQLDLPQA